MNSGQVAQSHDSRIDPYRRALPVLDVAPVLAGDRAGIAKVAAELREVSENVGFFCFSNHGLSFDLMEEVEQACRRFSDLAMEDKMTIKIDANQRGYVPPKATIIKHSTYNENTKLDTNETLVLATEHGSDNPYVIEGKQFYGANQWVAEDVLPGFRDLINGYMQTMTDFGKRMLPLWEHALDLPDGFFAPYFEDNYTYFRMAHYPPKAELGENEFGLGAHADTGFMTFLPPPKEEGIQIMDVEGNWFWPEVADGAMIVNSGQFLERWTNGRFRATPHRVVPSVDKERYSIPIFINPNFEKVCECLPTCHDDGNPPLHRPESYWDFYSWYMHNTYPHYGKVSGATED